MPSKKFGSKALSSARLTSPLGYDDTTGKVGGLGNQDTARLQETLQSRINGALGQLAEATQILNDTPDLDYTTQIDELLEDIVRQQNAIAEKHEALNNLNGDTSRTVNLGIHQGVTRDATARFGAHGQEHDKKIFYERAIQTIEQQLREFQRHVAHDAPSFPLDEPLDEMSDRFEDDESEVDLEDNRDDLVVAEYVRRCKAPTHDELMEEDKGYLQFWRRRRYDVLGCFFFVAFIIVACGYAYVRVRYSIAPLRDLIWYGVLIFIVEMLGAMSIMFYGVWLIATPDNSDVEGLDAAYTPLRRNYHIRVLVPTYSEPLAIVQRTVLAARRANVPDGCRMTIYLCDDGKRAEKRKFVESLATSAGPEVIYITGRKRGAGKTLNGKSENLNHCLKLIYPDDRGEDEMPNIPLTELMCLFDADQSCSRQFFTALLPYIDSGDNVAVALSPQLMFNVSPNVDIFNHQNVHFWEKMQPGMDALGFISLTGTNMILRCRALQDCGWFPTESVTEDWELGMRMKKWGWECRYVQQYNAIGEAPDEVRQCFQQRSRWCKGHFQTFWSSQCPLIDLRLGPFYALCYSSTCLSYISAALAVPIMTMVPIITLLFGYFPIALNLETVLAITLYYTSLHALTFYCKSMREFRALWLANIGTSILFWPFAKAALLTPFKQLMKRGISFKATAKGSQKSTVTLKEIGPSLLIVLLSLLAFICGLSDFDVNVNAPKAIALCWVLYNMVPHVLLLTYARFGSGKMLHWACGFLIVAQSIISLLALILLWVLYPREENYIRAMDLSLRFLYAQWSGTVTQPFPANGDPINWRQTSAPQYKQYQLTQQRLDLEGNPTIAATSTVDLSAGFYTGGEVGAVRVTTHVALTTAMLAWSMLDFQDWWAQDEERRQHGITLVKNGLDFVLNAYIPAPNVNGQPASIGDPWTREDAMVYVVGDVAAQRMTWQRPEDVTEEKAVHFVTARDAPADLAGQMVAGMVAGTLALLAQQDPALMPPQKANDNLYRAHRLFESVMLAPRIYSTANNASTDPLFASYPTNSYLDDLFWASTWLLRASNYNLRPENISWYYSAARTLFELSFAERDSMAVGVDYLNNVALVHAATITYDWSFHSAAQSWIWDWICSGDVKYTTFGRAWHPESMMLGDTAMAAAIAATYVHAARGWDKAAANEQFMTGFHCFAESQGRLFLGVNFRKPLLTGFNGRSYNHLWHRGASCPEVPAPCERDAATSDEPDRQELDGALLWLPGFRDEAPDVRGTNDENGTVVSLDNNVAVPLLFAALSDRAQKASYMDCLQGQGFPLILPHPVCRHDRPLGTRLGPEDTPVPERPERFKGIWRRQETQVAAPTAPPPIAGDSFLATDETAFDLDGGEVQDVESAADEQAFAAPATPAPTLVPAVPQAPATVPAVPAVPTTTPAAAPVTPAAPAGPAAPAVPVPGAQVAPAAPVAAPATPVAPDTAPVTPATPTPAGPEPSLIPEIPAVG